MKEGESLQASGRSWPLAPTAIEPRYRSNESASYPDHFKAYVLTPKPGTEVIATAQEKPVGVRHGRVIYIATELPHFAGLVENLIQAAATPSDCVLFAYQRGGQQLLSGVARHAQPVTATVDQFGFRLHLENCTSFVAAKTGDHISVLFSEGTVQPIQPGAN